jgi:hexosaminidase
MLKRMLFPILILFFLFGCKTEEPVDLTSIAIIPKPVSVIGGGKEFELNNKSGIYVEGASAELQNIGNYLAEKLNKVTGYDLKVAALSDTTAGGNRIILSVTTKDQELGKQGYFISIDEKQVKISANEPAGVFAAIQTIRQLFPDKIESGSKEGGPWKIPTGTIKDYPAYEYRGSMLDVSRHFFGIDDVKRYIDLLAFYKMNVFHLHLSDDQGWRIEIKSWPNLTTHGGSTQVGGGKGGFYTQEQYKEIVKYAQDRYITIIPEIDMPGHTNAALSSYPELNCNDSATKLYTGTEVGFSTLCVKKDITYKFIDDVVRELAAITPGPYIHLGGDESHATAKDDYLLFINKIQPIVKKYGKRMIGWEEAAQSNLDSSTVIQHWANPEHAKLAVTKGAKIIMSPATKVYLDMQYDSTTRLGLHWAAYIEIDSSYNWALSTKTPGIPRENILGVEAPLWSETVTNMDEIENLVFPRLPGIAEIGWTPEAARNWDEYKIRLGKHVSRMKAMDIDFYRSKQIPWADSSTVKK